MVQGEPIALRKPAIYLNHLIETDQAGRMEDLNPRPHVPNVVRCQLQGIDQGQRAFRFSRDG
jgi:hypothetical protein